ncbi:hypothetical protein [Mycolicibacterium arabiense]|nr:hypothetical protein [Mycolicibacterium arabiense]
MTKVLSARISIPPESQRRARIMFDAARRSHLNHDGGDEKQLFW